MTKMSKHCPSCPVHKGRFELKSGARLHLCSNPTADCAETLKAVQYGFETYATEDIQTIAEIGRKGLLPFLSLRTDDILHFHMAERDTAFFSKQNRTLVVSIVASEISSIIARVVKDSYNDLVFDERTTYALPEEEYITMVGSYAHAESANRLGELCSGMGVLYSTWRDQTTAVWTSPVQGIVLERQNLGLNVFNNDLRRPAPYPADV